MKVRVENKRVDLFYIDGTTSTGHISMSHVSPSSHITPSSRTDGGSELSSSEWAAIAVALVIAALLLLVLGAGIMKWIYHRQYLKKYMYWVRLLCK